MCNEGLFLGKSRIVQNIFYGNVIIILDNVENVYMSLYYRFDLYFICLFIDKMKLSL